MEDVDVAHFQDFSSCLVFDTLIISLALVLGPTVRFFFVGNINFPIECKWSAIQNNKHLVKKPKRWFQLWFSGIDDDDEGDDDTEIIPSKGIKMVASISQARN